MKFIIKRIMHIIKRIMHRFGYKIKKIDSDPENLWAGLSRDEIRRLFHHEKFMETKSVSGCIVECGVAGGGTLAFFSNIQKEKGDLRQIWAFDSFEGYPEGSDNDPGWFKDRGQPGYRKYTIEFVKNTLRSAKVAEQEIDSINFIKGWIPQSLSKYDGSSISLLNIDVNLYRATKDCLEYFWPLMSQGGVVMIDEYTFGVDAIKWPSSKKAVDEFCTENNIEVQIHYTGKAYLQK